MAGPCVPLLRFGPFELDRRAGELRRAGALVRLQGQPVAVLALLASRAGDVVSRDEIQAAVWGPGVHVDFEQGINACIRQIRAALADRAESPRYVQTLPRRGYRFLAPVQELPSPVAVGAAADTDGAAPSGASDPGGDGSAIPGGDASGLVPASDVATPTSSSAQLRGRRFAWAAALGAGLLLASWAAWSLSTERGRTAGAAPVLVVLPFVDLTGDRAGDLLADGMTEELIAQVGRRYGPRLPVIARTTAMTFKGKEVDVADLGRTLDADVVLEGSVRRDASRVRVTAQLVRTSDRAHVWAGQYDRSTGELIALENDVADAIARALGLRLLPGRDPAAQGATSAEVYEAVLDGRAALLASSPEIPRARAAFERAVALDPAFAPAWLGYGQAAMMAAPHAGGVAQAREAYRRALALDDGLAAAHLALANLHLYVDWDLDAAGREFRRALDLEPASAEAHHDAAAWWSVQGRHDEAIASVRRALRLDPLSPAVLADVGWYAYFAGRYDEATEGSRRALEVSPADYWARRCLLLVGHLRRDPAGVREVAERLAADAGDEAAALRASLASARGAEESARAFWRWDLDRKRRRGAATGRLPHAEMAATWMALGEPDRAIDALDAAARDRAGWILPFLGVDPLYAGLRSDPRFRRILDGIGIAPGAIAAGATGAAGDRHHRSRDGIPARRRSRSHTPTWPTTAERSMVPVTVP